MVDQHQQILSPLLRALLDDNISPPSTSCLTLIRTRGPCKSSKISLVRACGSCSYSRLALARSTELHGTHPETMIDMLPDDIFLEIFAFCVHASWNSFSHMREWQRLVKVCRRWRQIIYASPHYLDLHLYCSNGTPVRENLDCWPAFPIAMRYRLPGGEDDVISLLKHSDRVHLIDLRIRVGTQWEKLVAAMQEPFPVLAHLELSESADAPSVLPSGFLGGSAPRLQQVVLYRIPFPELPTLLLSARDLVSLRLHYIPPNGYISPEAMVAGLAGLTKLKTIHIIFLPQIHRRRSPNPPMWIVLPALADFEFRGCGEYLEDLVAQIDAPRLNSVQMTLDRLDSLQLPQLFLFIGRAENLKFKRAQVDFSGELSLHEVKIKLRVDRLRSGLNEFVDPHFSLSFNPRWSGTLLAHICHVLSQTFSVSSNVDYVYIRAGNHTAWPNLNDKSEWLALFHLLINVETLRVSGRLATQFVRVLNDFPSEMVTEVLPSLHFLMLEDADELVSPEQFVSLRQLHGRPVTIRDTHNDVEGVWNLQ